jgi:hypothetical protein
MPRSQKIRIYNSKDFYAGLIFALFGIFALFLARGYQMGNAMHMGPGYFPAVVGGVLAFLGLVIIFRSLWLGSKAITSWMARPLILVLGSVVLFALVIQPLGLVLATLLLIVISSLGSGEFRIIEVSIFSLVLAALAAGVFVYGIGLPINLWPHW